MGSNSLAIRSKALTIMAEGARKYILAFILLPSITIAVFWNSVAHWLSLIWLVASFSVVAFRYYLITTISSGKTAINDVGYWERLTICSSLISGLLWGLAVFLFFNTNSSASQIYLLGTIFGLASTALILSAWLPATYYAFVVPALAAVIARFLLEGGTQFNGFAILTLLYLGVVIGVIKNQHALAMESLKLRFENLSLMEKLQQEKELAETANLAKSKFLAAASHDLRQPMHSIGLFSTALESHTDNPDALRLINHIHQSVASLDNLLRVLLDISRLDAGVIAAHKEHVSLNDILERISNEYELQATTKGLQWQMQVDENTIVYSDSVLLETILRNLISNAIRYTIDGFVKISTAQKGEHVRLEIIDSGVGIPEESQQDIFNEFFQLNSTESGGASSVGLGLAIVKRIVDVLGCQISVHSELEKGSCFNLILPVGDINKLASKEVAPELGFDGTGISILVIDDDAVVLQGMEELLNTWSYNALGVASSEGAIAAVESTKFVPDIIVADYRLANNKTSIDTVKQLQNIVRSPIDVILVTGETAEQEIRELYSSTYKLLHKPVKPAALRALLRNIKINSSNT